MIPPVSIRLRDAPSSLMARPAWLALKAHFETLRHLHLRQLFADDRLRGERFALDACGLYLDYSKNRITDKTIRLLIRLAEECRLSEHVEDMFTGRYVNMTEQRAALHTALRAPCRERILQDGVERQRKCRCGRCGQP